MPNSCYSEFHAIAGYLQTTTNRTVDICFTFARVYKVKAVFQLHVFYTYVHARKSLNPFQYYI